MRYYSHNLMPYLSEVEPDEAGPDLAKVWKKYGIAPESMIMMSRNENPYGPSPSVRENLRDVPLHRYPDSSLFLESLAKYTGYPEVNIITGAGMDEIIITIARLFLGQGDRALISVPTYNVYCLAVRFCGALPVQQPRLPGFQVDPNIPDGMKMIFLCSPNNPTGNLVSEEGVRSIAESTDGIIFLDEAYAEFAEKSLLKLVKEYDNLVVGRTLSKAFGLAGLRLGYAVAPEWISAGHIDWHESGWSDLKVCVIIDDASRMILAGGEFKNINTKNSKLVVDELVERYWWLCPMRELIMDHGAEFGAHRVREDGYWDSDFKQHLERHGIKPILARVKHPQTNGKLERWFGEYKKHRLAFSIFEDFKEWYNNRPHGSLDFEHLETPEQAFRRKMPLEMYYPSPWFRKMEWPLLQYFAHQTNKQAPETRKLCGQLSF